MARTDTLREDSVMPTPEDVELNDMAHMIAELFAITALKPLYSEEELKQERQKFDAKWAKYGPFPDVNAKSPPTG